MNNEQTTIQKESHICIQDLADYNEGRLRFEWLDLNDFSDEEELGEYINNFLAAKGHEEYMIADYDEFINLGEYPTISELWEVWEAIQEHGLEPVKGFIDWYGSWDASEFEDSYNGEWDSWEDFVYDIVDQCGYLSQMPEEIRSYFDYEAFGRDLGFDYHEHNANGSTYVYRSC